MTESDFTVGRSMGFLLAVAMAVSLQRITPQARRRGSWRTNSELGLLDFWMAETRAGYPPRRTSA